MQSSQFILALLLGSGHSVCQGVGMFGTFVLLELLLLSFVFSVSCDFFLFFSDPLVVTLEGGWLVLAS